MNPIIHADCRHFLGDRPCHPHKKEGVKCGDCPHHEQVQNRILVIKLDALGDVLRSTCILEALHEEYPGARVEWVTRSNAAMLFEGNPLVHRVHPFPGITWLDLQTREYDIVINLDNASLSSQLAMLAKGRTKLGFGYHPDGYIFPFDENAREWYEMGLFDERKQANRKTYQTIAMEICGLPPRPDRIHLYLDAQETQWARRRKAEWGLSDGQTLVGLNTGSSARWPHKKWTEEGFITLARMLTDSASSMDKPLGLLLLGGPEERERNQRIAASGLPFVVDTGADNSLREFFAIVGLCDVVVTGDTL
ncbi:MAG: glycosyltransferase family 9 protein, partial [Rhodocyclaceae bacterium]|nr:glycosyltransferase family 9 protein [Rhodocyclaceae bacterium]